MSAMAPAGTETSMSGNISAACTSATMSADGLMRVISHAAPTPRINCPKLETRLLSQIVLNVPSRSGSSAPKLRGGACASVIAGLSQSLAAVRVPFGLIAAAMLGSIEGQGSALDPLGP